MSRDSERGIGYLLGHEEPETKAQRVRDIKRQIESSVRPIRPLSDPIDVFTSLPLATEVKLGTSNSLATPKITSPVEPKDKFGNTKAQKEKMIMDQITKPKPMPITKYISKINQLYGSSEVEEPVTDAPKKDPYWINRNGELLDANKAEQWQPTTKMPEKKKPKKPIYQQLTDLGNWDKARSLKNWDKASKTISTPIGNVKIINTPQKDIAKNKQGRKV